MRTFRQNLALAAAVAAPGILLPFLLGAEWESRLLTMQFFVLAAGFLLPVQWSATLAVGLPIAGAILLDYPPVLPDLPLVICQMVAYAAFLNMFYGIMQWKKYRSLLLAMLMGWLVYFSAAAIMAAVSDGFNAAYYTLSILERGWPGLVLQVALVPAAARLGERALKM